MESDGDIAGVIARIRELMGPLTENVAALQAILTEPEVPGDHA